MGLQLAPATHRHRPRHPPPQSATASTRPPRTRRPRTASPTAAKPNSTPPPTPQNKSPAHARTRARPDPEPLDAGSDPPAPKCLRWTEAESKRCWDAGAGDGILRRGCGGEGVVRPERNGGGCGRGIYPPDGTTDATPSTRNEEYQTVPATTEGRTQDGVDLATATVGFRRAVRYGRRLRGAGGRM